MTISLDSVVSDEYLRYLKALMDIYNAAKRDNPGNQYYQGAITGLSQAFDAYVATVKFGPNFEKDFSNWAEENIVNENRKSH